MRPDRSLFAGRHRAALAVLTRAIRHLRYWLARARRVLWNRPAQPSEAAATSMAANRERAVAAWQDIVRAHAPHLLADSDHPPDAASYHWPRMQADESASQRAWPATASRRSTTSESTPRRDAGRAATDAPNAGNSHPPAGGVGDAGSPLRTPDPTYRSAELGSRGPSARAVSADREAATHRDNAQPVVSPAPAPPLRKADNHPADSSTGQRRTTPGTPPTPATKRSDSGAPPGEVRPAAPGERRRSDNATWPAVPRAYADPPGGPAPSASGPRQHGGDHAVEPVPSPWRTRSLPADGTDPPPQSAWATAPGAPTAPSADTPAAAQPTATGTGAPEAFADKPGAEPVWPSNPSSERWPGLPDAAVAPSQPGPRRSWLRDGHRRELLAEQRGKH
jgi:hypothetical protein